MSQLKETGGRLYMPSKVVILPTNEKALDKGQPYLSMDSNSMVLGLTTRSFTSGENFNKIPQHLYFTSEEEIKVGDQFIAFGKVYECNHKGVYVQYFNGAFTREECRKIIATTDKSIGRIKPNHNDFDSIIYLPEPSHKFLEAFVENHNKGKSIIDVLIEYVKVPNSVFVNVIEAPYLTLKVDKDNIITIKPIKDIYTREEVMELFAKYEEDVYRKYKANITNISTKNWLKDNLKY